MRAVIAHGEEAAILFASEHQRDAQKHRLGHRASTQSACCVTPDTSRCRAEPCPVPARRLSLPLFVSAAIARNPQKISLLL